jgi:hypothetical protein
LIMSHHHILQFALTLHNAYLNTQNENASY